MSEDTSSAVLSVKGDGSDPPKLLQRVLDAARECVLVVDANLKVTNWNTAAGVAFGRPGMEIGGRRLAEVLRDLGLHQACKNAILSAETADVRLELVGPERRKFNVQVAPIELDSGRHAIAFFYDTTKVDRLESIRQEFLSNVSHELRTPLTSILAFVETLEDGAIEDPEHNRRFLATIRRNAERMSSLVSDILELSLIESGKVVLEKRDIRFRGLVAEVLTNLSARARERGVDLVNSVPESSHLHADPRRVEQMLTNLVDNAIKFNRLSGTVTVSAEQSTKSWLISVSDTGEGILPEHAERLFERFYRVDRARSREIGGTGLGLAIVKHLSRLHGGEVAVRSALDEGTTFTIELPRV